MSKETKEKQVHTAKRKELEERMVAYLRSCPGFQLTPAELIRAIGESVGGRRLVLLCAALDQRSDVVRLSRGQKGRRVVYMVLRKPVGGLP